MNNFVFVLFGGNGDLAWKKIHPSLAKLLKEGKISPKKVISCSRESSRDEFIPKIKSLFGEEYASVCDYINVDVTNPKDFNFIKSIEKDEIIFYLSIPPNLFESAIKNIGHVLLDMTNKRKIVIEKPFGYDLESAKRLNNLLHTFFLEKEIYRIDHFLGKEAVQNIFSFRFANYIFEGIWNKNFIDHVQISALEDIGIEGRSAYYDKFGAFKDMIQNHLTQMATFIAMEPPCCIDAEEIRNEKVKVLKSIRTPGIEDVVLGRYEGYTMEPGVKPGSKTETFAVVKLHIDNLRWHGVPFYLRTGKKLKTKATQIVVVLKKMPTSFAKLIGCEPKENKIVIKISPFTNIELRLEIRAPNSDFLSCPLEVSMGMENNTSSEAYETLLLDIINSNQTLFLREDEVELAWALYQPLLDIWKEKKDVELYEVGSYGPKSADILINKDNRQWYIF
ncbi:MULTISPECIES: glucose-6-phosphate dehydrogenase [unclassified Hydrogenobaculum]|uniref:glucose-6-phosphate dehydrogenase n=1 Tax=unclassified Hydrogenobaculum TaxID=2622382 RepID=UPI0001C51050|nr:MULTISPECIES: glucose-6-phosphate dehydrogenase [unclassified Hydrogenobaculum]AEF19649.1 glucose-6-phosphate 1-dehydrogenase [Hydrogenobaculum sp. 3684]AEG46937.1 glucose-6-phosphate 1-dehydrogenase [Hydrogenobaculum sp. SHO]AGG15584.1 glucose-6-phosphate 1-dehydrogenase [Hydrogenobaculum sp. HO]AGH93883.1 glucose-6-phosphate 1-dehydrogenase [Hydrogenobaculum sp. SN]